MARIEAGRDTALNTGITTADFFGQSVDLFERAAHGPAASFRVGGRHVRVQFSSPGLAQQLAPSLPLWNCEDAVAAPDLMIFACDANDVMLPRPSWSWDDYQSRGQIASLADGAYRAAYHFGIPTFSILDRAAKRAIFWAATNAPLPHYQVSSPFLHILHWWFADEGVQLVHGAAVGADGRALLLVGRGGSGKTTTALACALDGLQYYGDDYCAVDRRALRVYPVFASGKIFRADCARLPALERRIREDVVPGEKVVLDMTDLMASGSADIAAIVLPRLSSNEESSYGDVTRGEALSALAPSTLFQLGYADARAMREMAELVRVQHTYRLMVGIQASTVPSAVRDILRDAAGTTDIITK